MGEVDGPRLPWDPAGGLTVGRIVDQGMVIRDKRARLRMTQSALATASGVSLNTVKRAEAGLTVQDETIRSLCAVLELDVGSFPRPATPKDRDEVPLTDDVDVASESMSPSSRRKGIEGLEEVIAAIPFRDPMGPWEPWKDWDPSPEVRALIALGLIGLVAAPVMLVRFLGQFPGLAAPPDPLGWFDPGAINAAFSDTMLCVFVACVLWAFVWLVVDDVRGDPQRGEALEANGPLTPLICVACFYLLARVSGEWGVPQQLALTMAGVILGADKLSWLAGGITLAVQVILVLKLARLCGPLVQVPPLFPLGLAMGFVLLAPATGPTTSQGIAWGLVFACAVALRRPFRPQAR